MMLRDMRRLTTEEHRILKNLTIPQAAEDTMGVANRLLETVGVCETSLLRS